MLVKIMEQYECTYDGIQEYAPNQKVGSLCTGSVLRQSISLFKNVAKGRTKNVMSHERYPDSMQTHAAKWVKGAHIVPQRMFSPI